MYIFNHDVLFYFALCITYILHFVVAMIYSSMLLKFNNVTIAVDFMKNHYEIVYYVIPHI